MHALPPMMRLEFDCTMTRDNMDFLGNIIRRLDYILMCCFFSTASFHSTVTTFEKRERMWRSENFELKFSPCTMKVESFYDNDDEKYAYATRNN
jgi:hypothetical protein